MGTIYEWVRAHVWDEHEQGFNVTTSAVLAILVLVLLMTLGD